MTSLDALPRLLEATLVDGRLSSEERRELTQALAAVPWRTDQLQGLRNQAFGFLRARLDEPSAALLGWLDGVVRAIDQARPSPPTRPTQSFFSPGPDCKTAILKLLSEARATLDVCVFTISDDDITRQILEAHRRAVVVRLITDNDKRNDAGSDVDQLARAGITVRIDQSPAHMHHKFAIADGTVLLNGSFNWTRSATQLNSENVTVSVEEAAVRAFRAEFERLWQLLDVSRAG
jgi:phosphatidylserine/phosphatidylglycerophosphate/cardiolipin synthase-like enzyme